MIAKGDAAGKEDEFPPSFPLKNVGNHSESGMKISLTELRCPESDKDFFLHQAFSLFLGPS